MWMIHGLPWTLSYYNFLNIILRSHFKSINFQKSVNLFPYPLFVCNVFLWYSSQSIHIPPQFCSVDFTGLVLYKYFMWTFSWNPHYVPSATNQVSHTKKRNSDNNFCWNTTLSSWLPVKFWVQGTMFYILYIGMCWPYSIYQSTVEPRSTTTSVTWPPRHDDQISLISINWPSLTRPPRNPDRDHWLRGSQTANSPLWRDRRA
jgi:hypothetical protein